MTALSKFSKLSFVVFLSASLLQACATDTFRSKTYRNMAVATALGVIAAQAEKDNKLGYSLAYAGGLSSIAAIASIEYYDPDRVLEEQVRVNKELSQRMEGASMFSKSSSNSSKSFESLKSLSSIPPKYRSLIKPGEWKISAIDEWEQVDDYTYIHKTELFELTPPSFNVK